MGRLKINQLDEKNLKSAEPLLESYKYFKFRYYCKNLNDNKKIKSTYLTQNIKNILLNKGYCLIAEQKGVIKGLVALKHLPFDSKHFGKKMAEIAYLIGRDKNSEIMVKNALLSEALKYCKGNGIVHLSCRVDATDHSSIHALETKEFKLMDTLLTFAFIRKKHKIPEIRTIYPIRNCIEKDIPYLSKIAMKSFSDSRFHLDPSISREKANNLYSKWIKNSYLKGDPIFVALKRNRVVGFITYSIYKQLLEITGLKIIGQGLMAILPTAKGAGISLIKKTCEEVILNYDAAEHTIRISNRESFKIYQKFGLDVARIEHTFHKWK